MYIFILTVIALVLLPLPATAEGGKPGKVWEPPIWPPVIKSPYYWGDVLNVTKCYCIGLNEDSNYAHYYQFDYRNYYNEQVYKLAWTCDSDSATTGWGTIGSSRKHFPVPDCWNAHDLWRKEKRKECTRSYNGDIFCFELGNTGDPHDYYFFNKQKRGLPSSGIREFPPNQCVALWRDKLGGKVVASKCTFQSTRSLVETLVFSRRHISRAVSTPNPIL